MSYATSDDYIRFYGPVTAEQLAKLNGTNNNGLLAVVSNVLKLNAESRNINLDEKVTDSNYALIVSKVVCDVCKRELDTAENEYDVNATQATESALGYSQSITFNNAGGGIYLKQNDLKQLGWLKQKIMLVDPLLGGMND